MASWWMNRGSVLQQSVRFGEIEKVKDYTDEEARQATVHMREDITLLVGLGDALNIQIDLMRWQFRVVLLMGAAALLMAAKALHYF